MYQKIGMTSVRRFLDALLGDLPPSKIVVRTLVAAFLVHIGIRVLSPGFLFRRFNDLKWSLVRVALAPLINKKVSDAARSIHFPHYPGEIVHDALPAVGESHQRIIALCEELHERLDVSHFKANFSGVIYHGGVEHTAMVNKVMETFQWTNPLHFDSHGSVRKMEAEIVAMVLRMYNGQVRPDACGACTSGGTESIGMAIKTYRDWGRATLGIHHPSIVMPVTAHPAFDKACYYYGVEMVKVPVGPSGAVDPSELAKYIKYNTVAIVGSSVTFPHGTFDPIQELSEIAFTRGIGLHVDSCLGSFIVPFLAKAGFPNIPTVDFRCRGVTSISCDTHKYGFSPKGTSVVLYGSKELRKHHFFATADWPGGVYGSPGAAGSKPGNIIAGTWAAMLSFGESGYLEACRDIVNARITMTEGIRNLPGIVILGNPQGSVFSFTSTLIDIYLMSDRLMKLGWKLNSLQFPAGIQFSVTLRQIRKGVAETFVEDVAAINGDLLREAERDAAAGVPLKIGAQGGTLYGSQQRITDRTLLNSMMKMCMENYYSTATQQQ